MRIGIDISQIVYGTGVSIYTKELVRKLLEIDHENEYILYGGSLRNQFLLRQFSLSLKGNFETKILPISPTTADFIWNRIHRLKVEKLVGKVDVFHASDWTQPPTRAFKVTTIHDLSPILLPRLTPSKIVSVHGRRIYWVLKEADRIIVPSNSIKSELIKLGGNADKIRVIYEGISEEFKYTDRIYDIKDDYILTVGSGGRKNTEKLIEAFGKVRRKNLKLVIVGRLQQKYMDRRGVIQTGYVKDQDLAALYSHAKALVYPSLYEGFGLPIIQAFSCHCPVVTSNVGSMKEIADNAAVLVDPNDVNSIAEGIDEALRKPKEYIKKGIKRAKDFSWEKAAKETLEVYKEATS